MQNGATRQRTQLFPLLPLNLFAMFWDKRTSAGYPWLWRLSSFKLDGATTWHHWFIGAKGQGGGIIYWRRAKSDTLRNRRLLLSTSLENARMESTSAITGTLWHVGNLVKLTGQLDHWEFWQLSWEQRPNTAYRILQSGSFGQKEAVVMIIKNNTILFIKHCSLGNLKVLGRFFFQ